MTCLEKYRKEHPEMDLGTIIRFECPHESGGFNIPVPEDCDHGGGDTCVRCWNRIFLPVMAEEPHIRDSGSRTEFQSGAVRDIQKGKGRCDLMPLDVVAWALGVYDDNVDLVVDSIANFVTSGNIMYLYDALVYFRDLLGVDNPTLFLEVSKHFEDGAEKYGENNWQKGIPLPCYINSAVRHYLKWLRGDQDEPHDRAFCWNILCAIWTCKHHPDLNPYGRRKCVVCGADIPANEDACPKCRVYARPPENTCVCCGAPIPEGRQVCPSCEELPGQMNMFGGDH